MNQGPDDLSSTGEFDSDELALRRLLHQAVQEMEPRDGTLDHLRKAVPARRARKRQAVVGMAAAALFFGTAIPAVVHVSSTRTSANTSNAGHTSQMQGGAGQGKQEDGGESTSGGSAGKPEDKGKGGSKDQGKGKSAGASTGASSGTDPSATTSTSAAVCTAAQLGTPTASTAGPDASGTVYGTFHITNGSSDACTVTGPGIVTTSAQGAADSSKIVAQRHVSGDAASAGLPDPSQEVSQLVLQPGSSYDVKFAWVPSETCPTSEPSTDPSPDPTTSPDTSTGEGSSTGGDTGTSTQLLTDGGTLDGSVLVGNTAEGGGPSVSTTVSNACAGVVYWTGVLPSA
ncbi:MULTISPECIES: hypothetical protein [Streptomyces]|uniref:hypothetical protein n=1 Tax=Streptomyces TaxID=1883 RepID=UPI0001852B03|nr:MULTISPECIES: hypothetical protein [Streptomyces]MYT07348.1 hypothetical protein [Streptomyces sp. SID5470]